VHNEHLFLDADSAIHDLWHVHQTMDEVRKDMSWAQLQGDIAEACIADVESTRAAELLQLSRCEDYIGPLLATAVRELEELRKDDGDLSRALDDYAHRRSSEVRTRGEIGKLSQERESLDALLNGSEKEISDLRADLQKSERRLTLLRRQVQDAEEMGEMVRRCAENDTFDCERIAEDSAATEQQAKKLAEKRQQRELDLDRAMRRLNRDVCNFKMLCSVAAAKIVPVL
jgi:predicted ribosome quality control (RQC) complex YloA/Tae2 family protein